MGPLRAALAFGGVGIALILWEIFAFASGRPNLSITALTAKYPHRVIPAITLFAYMLGYVLGGGRG